LTLMACIGLLGAIAADADALPPDFAETTAFANVPSPTSIAFSPDGRVFVAEKSGIIEVFDGLGDTTPTRFADLRDEVHNFWDRGLLGMTLDPQFPDRPYVYLSYTYDAPIGGTAPTWGVAGSGGGDGCPSPPGATGAGCVVSGRLSRLTATGNSMSSEKVLVNDWCQQFPSHSVGDVAFGKDGLLYMTGGEGASFNYVDYGQTGNPCGDPPGGVGGTQTVPTAEGGALRSQDSRTSGDPLGLSGSLIRVDPATGRPVPDLPENATQSELNAGRIVAYGLRNPFRIAIRPGTNDVWIGDVGWDHVEEIDRVGSASKPNFGWPCYEGTQRPYDVGLNLCDSLYGNGGATAPYFSYAHGAKIDPAETCTTTNGAAVTGLEFYERKAAQTAAFPSAYDGGLFFGDNSRGCIWFMKSGTDGLPDPASAKQFSATQQGIVDLEEGPDGALYYASLNGNRIQRIAYESSNRAPTARATATPNSGAAPLSVQLDASTSTDPDAGDALSFAWDLDGDGAFDDSTAVAPTRVYGNPGSYDPAVRVTDRAGEASVKSVRVEVGSPPVPAIETPEAGAEFSANETFGFSGSATDAQDGEIGPSGLDWTAVIHHCNDSGGCHPHELQGFSGVASGELTLPAHERPYFLTLTLTATDSSGLQRSTSVDVYPKPNEAPVPTIELPAPSSTFSAGERIDYGGAATDREDGIVPASGLHWELVRVDCTSGDCVVEPLAALPDGAGGSFTAPADVLPSQLRLELTATDSEGATAQTSVAIDPRVVTVTVDSRRDRARVSILGRHLLTPATIETVRGADVRIATPQLQHAGGHGRRARLRWLRWSDGGDRAHSVRPARDTTYGVSYRLERPADPPRGIER
jgi:glucose/arabinose dehydrogenase